MCGIAGAFRFDGNRRSALDPVVSRINDFQRQRGPDGSGLWSSADGNIVFGHRRLSIIDIGPGGAQPMTDVTGRWTITFNGEIYNYRAIRSDLIRQGVEFHTESDTEVLINVIAQWGERGLSRLRGMYAFALWDSLRHELWLVRDPYGIKPLYVAQTGGTIWFASQARALATCAPVDTSREPAALTGFYIWGHIPEPFSWWRGIEAFPAGHVQRLVLGKPNAAPKPFLTVEDVYCRQASKSEPRPDLKSAVLDSVRHHLVADVPVGLFLSSGVDSMTIAALASELGARLQTMTLAFDEYKNTTADEAPIAEAVAKKLGFEHSTIRVNREEFEGLVDEFFKSMDQPTIDGLNSYLISWAAKARGIKVALSGLGGDELFGSYPSFRQIPQLLKWGRWLPSSRSLSRGLQSAWLMIAPSNMSPKIPGLLTHTHDTANAYLLRRALYLEFELDALLDESWLADGLQRLSSAPGPAKTAARLQAAGTSVYGQVAALESIYYMRNQLLRDADWSSMAHGVEVRVPFADVVLLETLAPSIASDSPPTKNELAVCAEGRLGKAIQRPKAGFTTPVAAWIGTRGDTADRGLRGWATNVHRYFRVARKRPPSKLTAA